MKLKCCMHIQLVNGYFVHEKTSSTGRPQTGGLQLADLAHNHLAQMTHQFQDIAIYFNPLKPADHCLQLPSILPPPLL